MLAHGSATAVSSARDSRRSFGLTGPKSVAVGAETGRASWWRDDVGSDDRRGPRRAGSYQGAREQERTSGVAEKMQRELQRKFFVKSGRRGTLVDHKGTL